MKYTHSCKGTCSKSVTFILENGMIKDVHFNGGCAGNALGVSSLVEGLPAMRVIEKLKGIRCGYKHTSCPDQLACAVEAAIKLPERTGEEYVVL